MSNRKVIYADNAATSPLSENAYEAMLPFLRNNFANASQIYSFSRDARIALKNAREKIASCIGASADEIYFTSGGTESNNWVINGGIEFETDIVTSAVEHHSILKAVEHAERLGHNVNYLPVERHGVVELNKLVNSLHIPGVLVSIMFANNEIGTIQHIAELASITHEHKGIFHTDAVQCVGHVDIDVKSLNIDMLSASAHKFNGPKGIGFLYIRQGLKWPPLIYGGAQENGLRAGTENIASIVGMATALDDNVSNIANNTWHITKLENAFLYELYEQGVPYHRNGDDRRLPGIISLSFQDLEGEMLLHRLDLMGILVSTGSACDSKRTQISHVLQAIGLEERYSKGTIRISLGKQNTIEEAKEIAKAIGQIVKSVKNEQFSAITLS